MIKIAAIYTGTTPELIATVNGELEKTLGRDIEITNYQDPSILQEARDAGFVTKDCARRLIALYSKAAEAGADIIYNLCSSVGDVAKVAKPLFEIMGYGFVRIDELMAETAVAQGKRIGVVATLPTTLEPTKRLLSECAARAGKEVVLVDALAEGAFGLNPEDFKSKLISTVEKIIRDVDVVVLAQGSMAYAEQAISDACKVPVLSSPRFGAVACKNHNEK